VKSDVFYSLVLERSDADFKLKMKGGVIFAGQAGRPGLFSFHQKGGKAKAARFQHCQKPSS